jgi:hypothetical protein
LAKRLLDIFTLALLGYIWGWIWGWSLVDPNLDVWALLAAVGALLGLVLGVVYFVRGEGSANFADAPPLQCATFGMFIGWAARTLLFGDVPGGPGLLVMLAGAGLGAWVGARPPLQSRRARRTLLVVLYAGFFGGFIVDMLLRGMALSPSIPRMALIVIACGVLGGAAAWYWKAGAN